jgi:hypothetical protein
MTGWSSDNSIYHGTYEASWTWFEAGICTPDGVERNVTPCLIQVNVHAEETAKDHEIVWDVGEKDLKIKEWLDELRSGDVVAVYPMARFPGWRNNVLSVAVEVYYTL